MYVYPQNDKNRKNFTKYSRQIASHSPLFSAGYCYSLIAYSTLQSWLDTINCCRNLLYLMETLFDQAPWLRCPPELDKKCLVVTEKTKLSMDCKLAENSTLMWCPDRGEFDFSTQLWFK